MTEAAAEKLRKRRVVRETSFVLVAFMFSGAAALIYEVTWTRALSLVLGSSVYALSTMLSTFMAGLALGAWLAGRFCDKGRNLLFAFGLCELGIGISGLASIPVIYSLPSLYLAVYRHFHVYPAVFFAFQVLICVIVMLVPTVLMGATFPIVSRKVTESMEEMGRKVARAYSLNTVGAVLGSLAAGFFLIPAVGLKGTATVAAFLNTAVAIAMLMMSGRRVMRTLAVAAPLLASSLLWAYLSEPETSMVNFYTAGRLWRQPSFRSAVENEKTKRKEVFHEENAEGQVKAFRARRGELVLLVGGKIEGTGQADLPSAVSMAYLPVAAHPEPMSFLTVGLGAGITLASARTMVPDVDLVEINAGVVHAVRQYGPPGVLDGVRLIEGDARNYLLTTDKRYDIISSEPSYPTDPGVSNLYTKEFYESASTRLKLHGIYCQWLPRYLMRQEEMEMMAKTFGSVFKYSYVWEVKGSRDVIMVGSLTPLAFSAAEIHQRFGLVNKTGLTMDVSLLMGPEDVREVVAREDVPVNSDDRPRLEFSIVRHLLNPCTS